MARKYVPKNKFPKLTADQRAAIIDLKRQKESSLLNISISEIARNFNCDPKTIRNTFKKWTIRKKSPVRDSQAANVL